MRSLLEQVEEMVESDKLLEEEFNQVIFLKEGYKLIHVILLRIRRIMLYLHMYVSVFGVFVMVWFLFQKQG